MIRTQVYIPDNLFQELRLLAQKEQKNQSELIREGIEELFKNRQKKQKKKDLSLFIGAGGKGGPIDISTTIDEHLYGKKI